jgi:hypothetical protein
MPNKIDDKTFAKIIDLKQRYGLTNAVLAERFGVAERTIRVYTRAARTGTKPYNVPSEDSPETAE